MIDSNRHMDFESDYLVSYASKNADSRGRVHPEPEHPYRPPFERDRERIVHSNSFRRLTYKTQVFVNHEGDHYRTRLTHTIETATVARAIASALGANTDLCEAISLAHDLGHTPFGHTGEETLNELLSGIGGFEHNRQSLRVVDLLEKRYPAFDGLNLTFETREGIQKHVTRYDFAGKNDEFPDRWPSLEAQIVCIADEIAFLCHDLDDGIYSGLLSLDEVESEAPLWAELVVNVKKRFPNIDAETLRKEAVRNLIDLEVTDAIEETERRLLISKPVSSNDIRVLENRLVSHGKNMDANNRTLEDFLYERLYRHYKVLRMSMKARRIIEALFKVYTEDPYQLPRDKREQLNIEDPRIVVADYIAGMTDRYAILEYKKMFDPFERML